jgi:hypothetical protein
MSLLFRLPEAPSHARPAVGTSCVSSPKEAAEPGVLYGPPTAGEVARRLEHRIGYDGSKLRERLGSPMQFLSADRLPDDLARALVNHLLEQGKP